MNKEPMPLNENGRYAIVVQCKDSSIAVHGSKKIKCMRCDEECWISPSLQNEKLDGAICTQCISEEEMKEASLKIKEEAFREVLIFYEMERMNRTRNYGG